MMPQDYISSFSFDQRLAPYDIQGSIAHVTMLADQKIIPISDSKKIIAGLEAIQKDLEKGKTIPKAEDIHFAIENELVKRIGEVGKKMHTARSRNDQVALDLKLYVRDFAKKIIEEIKQTQNAILKCAIKNQKIVMPGFTHLQHGQPIFFAHHILAYAWMLERDKSRFLDLLKRLDECPLGACAMAGTTFSIDRNETAKLLGFSKITENSVDTVSDRDFILDFNFSSSLLMVHLSRLAEEFIIWSSQEFNYIILADQFTSGSSIMPQKRNPDTLELLRGKTSRAIGNITELLTLIKGQPLSYNRDLQEDKPPLFDTADTTLLSLLLTRQIFETLKVNSEKMEESCHKGFLLSTEVADYLAKKGMPFRKAHAIVSKIVKSISAENKDFKDLSLAELKSFSPLFEKDLFQILSPQKAAQLKNSYGGTGIEALTTQISKLKSLLKIN